MKEKVLILSFTVLLLISPGILSQVADKLSNESSEPATTLETATALETIEKPAQATDQESSQENTQATSQEASQVAPQVAPQADSQTALEPPAQAPSQTPGSRIQQAVNEINRQEEIRLAKINTNSDDNSEWLNEQLTLKGSHITEETVSLSDEELARLREIFLQAEQALKKNKQTKFFQLTEQLQDYPLYPYIQYQWLRKNLSKKEKVQTFLQQNKSSRYARKLKRHWLFHLAKRKQWPLFLQNYYSNKETRLNCYHHLAQYHTGNKTDALAGAKKLWAVGKSQPDECDSLFAELKKSSEFTQELVWQRFDAALQNNKYKLAKYIKKQMPAANQNTAKLWLNLHRNPSSFIPKLLKRENNAQTALMFRHAIDRLAARDISAAIDLWDAHKQDYDIDDKHREKLEKRLAFKLVYKREAGAFDRLGQLPATDNSSRTWRVRVALSEQNWPNVLTAIQALNEDEIQNEKWQYWQARASLETGQTEKAQTLLTKLANNRSFYGYLAADKVNSLYQLSDKPIIVADDEITKLENHNEFKVAHELMLLDRVTQAKLQWWHAIRQLNNNKNNIMIAAKLAQQWQWEEVAIFTVAKAKHWDDIEMRFPLSYADKIHAHSVEHKLNPVILFGLIRRESAFNENARSPAGARGLMQIMPGTGREIARNLKERWRGKNSLYNPVTNLKYGAYYYQKLLNQFDGNYALALAAYNAGPHRVKKWLPENNALPADIWIETIPYHETREYVATVLAYAMIYQQRTQPGELSMNELTRDVQPKSSQKYQKYIRF